MSNVHLQHPVGATYFGIPVVDIPTINITKRVQLIVNTSGTPALDLMVLVNEGLLTDAEATRALARNRGPVAHVRALAACEAAYAARNFGSAA